MRIPRIASAIAALAILTIGIRLAGQQSPAPVKPAKVPARQAAKPPAGEKEFFLHAFHAKDLGLDCNTCHVPEKEGSVVFKRPGHDQCMTCHAEAFTTDLNQKICAQCHTVFPPSGGEDVLKFPRFQKTRVILSSSRITSTSIHWPASIRAPAFGPTALSAISSSPRAPSLLFRGTPSAPPAMPSRACNRT